MRKISGSKYAMHGVALAVRLWSSTFRYTRIGYEKIQRQRAEGPVIFSLWHDELFAPCYLHRDEGIVAVVSASGDGEFLAQVLARLGFRLARGSSSRHGMQALRQAIYSMRTAKADVVFTVDGPRGPRHLVKEGAVYIAAKSGLPLVPVRVQMRPVKRFDKAWDRFQLPLPGAACTVCYGQPYRVQGPRLTSSLLRAEQERLQTAMHDLKANLP